MLSLLLIAMLVDETAEAASGTSADTFSAEQVRQFEVEVRPVLHEHCLKCHGPEKQWAGLRLDSREAILKGGDSGPAAVPSKADASLLVKAIRHEDENLQMPQDEKLSDTQIESIVEWINSGLPFPAAPKPSGEKRHRDLNHWAFQKPQDVQPPEVADTQWVQTEIDRFILARLEAAGLQPAPRADKRTLIRRLTFDLTGLPPTPKEIAEFVADESKEAYEKLVDRLLDSPAYGERWGRHWLDVARYADSNGLDENVAHGNAWRYRDYVVQSFNSDKPFDRFITEQLAGDLISVGQAHDRDECLTATGFLSIGPKVLAEVNMPKMRMDIVDEQIDTVGRVFMGMTLGCARCHDHKFDPIDAADYYGLAGIFKSTKTMDTYTKVAKWHEHPVKIAEAAAMQAEYDAQLAAKKKVIEDLVARTNADLQAAGTASSLPPESLEPLYPEATKAELAKLREELASLEKAPPELPSAMGVAEDEVVDVAIHVRGNPSRLGDVVARHLPPVMSGPQTPAFSPAASGRLELAKWLVDPEHPLTARVLTNRFWRWHFGEGLVRSTDNFGLLGEKPTHPELLDWLARQFIRDGWSLKKFHRRILNSSTYQQSMLASRESLSKDVDNSLLSRFALRRLQAEEIRDSILFVSGQLDRTMGGSLLKVKNRGYLFDHTSIDTTDYSSNRRSLYLPVIRNNVFDVFQLLDFPDPAVPTGDRSTTTVAPQALLMMNSELVMQAAETLAKQVIAAGNDDISRNRTLYLTCVGREPAEAEISDNRLLIDQVMENLADDEMSDEDKALKAWSLVCHVVLASNEFSYVP